MNELDLLKKYWKRDENFPRVEQQAIRRMIYKSSSSIVKWIFLISVIEFALGIVLSVWYIFFDPETNNDPLILKVIGYAFDFIVYIAIIYFMYNFFSSYKKIKNTKNTKELLGDILAARKNVHNYIQFNIYLVFFNMAMAGVSLFLRKNMGSGPTGEIIMEVTLLLIVLFLIGWLCITLVKLYYRLIYLRLVKKLDRNYEELIRLEDESEPENPTV